MPSILESFRGLDDVRRKLARGICQIDGKWVYTGDVDGHGLAYYPDVNKPHIYIGLEQPFNRINAQRYKMGMINTENGVYFATRVHQKQWALVLNSANTEVHCLNEMIPTPRIERLFSAPGFAESMDNKYPLLWTAWDKVATPQFPNVWLGRAFNRDFALVRSGLNTVSLVYRTTIIGEFTIDANDRRTITTLALYPSFQHLKERIKALGIRLEN